MIDELDRKIIRVLNTNARKSFREIGKEVGTSATSVIHTVKKLEAAGAVKGYIPVIDPEYFGIGLAAIVAVRISKGKLIETQKRIAQDPHVAAVYDVTGTGIISSSAASPGGGPQRFIKAPAPASTGP
jgi:DNA-binding Lrp family transcriptional regulator